MCIEALASCVCRFIGCSYQERDIGLEVKKVSTPSTRGLSTLSSIEEEPEWARNMPKLDISDRQNCKIEWDDEAGDRH